MGTTLRSAAPAFRWGMRVLVLGFAVIQLGLSWVPQRASYAPATDDLAVQRLMDEAGCWTSATATDAHVMPGSALVTLPGGDPELVDPDIGFAIWLEGRPGVLHAFCAGLVGDPHEGGDSSRGSVARPAAEAPRRR
jgi:hypothetical protein